MGGEFEIAAAWFVSIGVGPGVDVVEVLEVVDVDFVWIHADNGAVLFVELLYVEDVLAWEDHVVVDLIP